jgi:hypothetical protein
LSVIFVGSINFVGNKVTKFFEKTTLDVRVCYLGNNAKSFAPFWLLGYGWMAIVYFESCTPSDSEYDAFFGPVWCME